MAQGIDFSPGGRRIGSRSRRQGGARGSGGGNVRTLITGGAGFIGSHLAEELLHRGHRVAILDDLSTGARENIEPLVGRDEVRFVKSTVLDERIVRSLVEEVDMVFHLAAAGGGEMEHRPLRGIQVNVRGTENVLEACARAGRRVLVASSSEVYGKDARGPFREEEDLLLEGPTARRWGSAYSRVLGEVLAMAYHVEKGLPAIVVRFFDVCGPQRGARRADAMARFVCQALRGEPLTLSGDGKQVRSFADVSDAVEAVLGLAAHPGAVGQVFNVGSPEEVTLETLALKIQAMAGSRSRLAYVAPGGETADSGEAVRYRVPDISKMRNLTGYVPRVPLDEILRRVIAHTAAALGAPGAPSGPRAARVA